MIVPIVTLFDVTVEMSRAMNSTLHKITAIETDEFRYERVSIIINVMRNKLPYATLCFIVGGYVPQLRFRQNQGRDLCNR